MITWRERMNNLRQALGREPSLPEMLECVPIHTMTPEEVQAQRESWVRAFQRCDHGMFDFEECRQCRAASRTLQEP